MPAIENVLRPSGSRNQGLENIGREGQPPVIAPNEPTDVELLSRAETPLDVGRPAADVYTYLADFMRHVEWAHTYLSVKPVTPGPVEQGYRLQVHEKQDLRWDKRPFTTISDHDGPTYSTLVEITALEPDRRIAWRTISQGGPLDGVRGEWEFVLEPVADAITTVRLRARLLEADDILAVYGADLLRQGHPVDILARQVDRAMHNIRAILEGR
jgi:hypothetical protein